MAIKLNGVEITSNKLNNLDILVERINGTVVYSFSPTLHWQFVDYYSSEPDYDDLRIYQDIDGDYEQGILYLDQNYPAGNFYKGFVAVIGDYLTQDFFEYVVVAG